MGNKLQKEWPVITDVCYVCKEVKDLLQRQLESKGQRTNVCEDCRRKASNEYRRKKLEKQGKIVKDTIGRYPYPLKEGFTQIVLYHRSLAKITDTIMNRDEWKKLISDRLDVVLEDKELMNWIWAHDNAERMEEQKQRGKYKKRSKELINTKNITLEEWESMNMSIIEEED